MDTIDSTHAGHTILDGRPVKFLAAISPVLVVISLVSVGLPAAASAATPSSATASVTVVPEASGSLSAGQDLVLVVTITAPASHAIAAGTATITAGRSRFDSRASIDSWFAGKGASSQAGSTLTTVASPAVAAGLSAFLPVTIPAATLGFGVAGVYPVAVALANGSGALGAGRTAVSWNVSVATSIPVAVAAPLTVPPSASDPGLIGAKSLASYTGPDGILTKELDDLAGAPVAIGIDPRIIASIRILGKSVPQTAKDWLDRLAAVTNDTFPLAWADADLTVGLQAGQTTVPQVQSLDFAIDPTQFGPASATPTPGATPTPTPTATPDVPPLPTTESLLSWNYTLPAVSWPAENSVTGKTLTALARSGYKDPILSSTNVSAAAVDYGASAKVGDRSIAVSDDSISQYLRDAVKSQARTSWRVAMTELSMTTAQLSLGSPTAAPVMLATLGRNWLTSSRQLDQTLEALDELPSVETAKLSDAIAAPPTTVKVVNREENASRVDEVQAMFQAEAADAAFSPIAAQPLVLTSSRRVALLGLLSNEWQSGSAAWYTATNAFLAGSRAIADSVQVVDSSNVLFLTSSGALPITVSNTFNQAVKVFVTVRSSTTQLAVESKYQSVELVVNANSQRKAQVPVQSLSNGKVRVTVTLYSESGSQVGATKSVKVNVQAGWETVGTIVFAVLVVGIFAFGIFRTVRRRRRVAHEQ